MSDYRMIKTKFWDDDYISNLDSIEKLLFLYCLTNPLTNIAGIYEITLKRIAYDTGIDKDMALKILERFEADNKMVYRNGWLYIRNFIKNQSLNIKITAGINRIIKSIPQSVIDSLSIAHDSLSMAYDILELELELELELKRKEKNKDLSGELKKNSSPPAATARTSITPESEPLKTKQTSVTLKPEPLKTSELSGHDGVFGTPENVTDESLEISITPEAATPETLKNQAIPRTSVTPKPKKKHDWPQEDLWLFEVIQKQNGKFTPYREALSDHHWWELLSISINGLSQDFLETEFAKMQAWLIENRSRAPTPNGVKRFVRRWLESAYEQERKKKWLLNKKTATT